MILNQDSWKNEVDPRVQWLNPPKQWHLEPEPPKLVIHPDAPTDFWQQTHYGFRADNGHFLGLAVEGDFTVSARVAFYPVHQYDQAGLMVRGDAQYWVKASVEHELHGLPQLGAVVTSSGFSDWSLQDFTSERKEIDLRITKNGADIAVEFKDVAGPDWRLMRLAHWHAPPSCRTLAGIYACSPKGAGFQAAFTNWQIHQATTKPGALCSAG